MKDIYESHKRVHRTPMNRLDYNTYRAWDLPADEDGSDEGYLVEYLDGGKPNDHRHKGYISWSPKAQFDNGYTLVRTTNLTFGQAIEAAKQGHKVSRAGWNASGMFAYIVPAAKYKAQTSVILDMAFDNDMVPYREYWALFTVQKDVAMWAPSGSDSLAEDWCIV
ncbi:MAG: DUF2829 domain-containing protein [Pseudoalteromonas sp.]|uniref:DUF2829 domain-containing protein n=1 Tax=Pseudoalteromonas sp. TaxID=53249 RepID=UPI001DD1F547|nr:DUF2829 domain-containing protein [Pseudoalteromonas sp.]NRA77118.1 DUF2829 domain-containing protein [Pseudoalteromonas sp.]